MVDRCKPFDALCNPQHNICQLIIFVLFSRCCFFYVLLATYSILLHIKRNTVILQSMLEIELLIPSPKINIGSISLNLFAAYLSLSLSHSFSPSHSLALSHCLSFFLSIVFFLYFWFYFR